MKKLFLLFLTVATLTACKKGDKGEPGTNGTNGAANIQTTTFLNQGWTNSGYWITETVPGVTQSVIDKGAVLVYIRTSNTGNYWSMLPNGTTFVIVNVGSVEINSTVQQSDPVDIKVVVIPAQ